MCSTREGGEAATVIEDKGCYPTLVTVIDEEAMSGNDPDPRTAHVGL